MIVLAHVMLVLIIIHLAMMILNPLIVLRNDKGKRWFGLRITSAWFGMFCGYCICGYIFKLIHGRELLLTVAAWNALAVTAWAAFFAGLVIVLYGTVKVRRIRRHHAS